jgi:hypothetical protein
VWKTLAELRGTEYTKLPVVLEDVRILHPLEIPEQGIIAHCKYNTNITELEASRSLKKLFYFTSLGHLFCGTM